MSDKTEDTIIASGENPAETMRKVMADLGRHEVLPDPLDSSVFKHASLITVPDGRRVENVTDLHRAAAEFLKPARRRGTARMYDLDSLCDWAKRFGGETSALFAKPELDAPALTCVADYHAHGPADPLQPGGDPTARHCAHRAIYQFPLSEEWKAWMVVDGQPLKKDDMGEFIEANAKDILDPTPAVLKGTESDKNQEWENRLIRTAQKIEGRYGQLTQLLQMSRQFAVYETSDLKVSSNRDTGEAEIQFLNEHKDANGKPLRIPNLIIIAIPVFLGGAPYRMPVRFRYRKMGSEVRFSLSVYNPEKAFEAAFHEALQTAQTETGLPLFLGTPED